MNIKQNLWVPPCGKPDYTTPISVSTALHPWAPHSTATEAHAPNNLLHWTHGPQRGCYSSFSRISSLDATAACLRTSGNGGAEGQTAAGHIHLAGTTDGQELYIQAHISRYCHSQGPAGLMSPPVRIFTNYIKLWIKKFYIYNQWALCLEVVLFISVRATITNLGKISKQSSCWILDQKKKKIVKKIIF